MIPLKIETLLAGRVVEQDRVEYKKGWNPQDTIHSVPFDDRINRLATIDHIRRGFLEDFLRESNSSLVSELNTRPMEDILI